MLECVNVLVGLARVDGCRGCSGADAVFGVILGGSSDACFLLQIE
jgi:hypothetical protein